MDPVSHRKSIEKKKVHIEEVFTGVMYTCTEFHIYIQTMSAS